jgi:hypothetical protein
MFSYIQQPTQPLIELVPGHFTEEVNWPGREADHPRATSAEVKKSRAYNSTPPPTLPVIQHTMDCTEPPAGDPWNSLTSLHLHLQPVGLFSVLCQ